MRLRKPTTVSAFRRRSVGKHFAAFQLALTLSIAGATSVDAQSELPELPKHPAAITSPAQSLPIVYPFESRQQRLERTSSKLMGILGLSSRTSQTHRDADPTLQASPSHAFALQAGAQQGVIPAAASEPEKLDLPSADGVCHAKLELPCSAQPESTCVAAKPLTCEDIEQPVCVDTQKPRCEDSPSPVCETIAEGSETPSLIDIEIPLEAPQQDVASAPSALPVLELTPRQPEVVSPKRTMSLLIEAPRLKSEVAAEEISQRHSKRNRVEADAIAVPVAPLKLEAAESQGVTASLSDEEGDTSDEPSFAFSFSDNEEASGVPKSAPAREAALHLSSSSNTKTSIQSVVSEAPAQPLPLPKKKMVVRIEGEPAVVVKNNSPVASKTEESVVHNLSDRNDHAASQEASPQRLRVSLASLVTPSEQPVSANASTAKREYVSGPSIRLRAEDATVINFEGPVSKISVENPGICQAIQTSASSLSLVGLEAGTTRLAIISENSGGSNAIEIREVTVSQSRPSQTTKVTSLAAEMSATIARLYPSADVEVIAINDGLMVQGVADSEADARKILSLVRKASLTPVVDRLRAPQ